MSTERNPITLVSGSTGFKRSTVCLNLARKPPSTQVSYGASALVVFTVCNFVFSLVLTLGGANAGAVRPSRAGLTALGTQVDPNHLT